jgi:hypothetical protein
MAEISAISSLNTSLIRQKMPDSLTVAMLNKTKEIQMQQAGQVMKLLDSFPGVVTTQKVDVYA